MHTEIIVILDRSGSMASIADDMEGGLRSFVKEQQELKEGTAEFTLVQFDDQYEVPLAAVPIGVVDPAQLKLVPRGCTALLDAIGKTVATAKERHVGLDQKPDKTVLAIITDGYENASKEFTREQVVKELNDLDWDVVYLGANQDAIREGARYGINRGQTLTYQSTGDGVGAAFASLSCAVSGTRSTGQAVCFTDDDRRRQGA